MKYYIIEQDNLRWFMLEDNTGYYAKHIYTKDCNHMKNVSEPKYLTDDIYTACLEISKNVTKDEWNKELFLVMI
jgi:hypothetical protein